MFFIRRITNKNYFYPKKLKCFHVTRKNGVPAIIPSTAELDTWPSRYDQVGKGSYRFYYVNYDKPLAPGKPYGLGAMASGARDVWGYNRKIWNRGLGHSIYPEELILQKSNAILDLGQYRIPQYWRGKLRIHDN